MTPFQRPILADNQSDQRVQPVPAIVFINLFDERARTEIVERVECGDFVELRDFGCKT